MRRFLLSVTVVAATVACHKVESVDKDIMVRDCLVSIVPAGEISVSESPMTKAESLSNDYYFVQVYENKDLGMKQEFACGYFNDLSKMNLYLKRGLSYTIEVCLIKNLTAWLDPSDFSTVNGTLNLSSDCSYAMFPSRTGSYDTMISNTFFYNSDGYYIGYSSLSSTSALKYSNETFSFGINNYGYLNAIWCPVCTDWLYAEVDYTSTEDCTTLKVPLKRVGFKLKYQLSGVTDGSVRVKIFNSRYERTFIDNITTSSTYDSETIFIVFFDTGEAWRFSEQCAKDYTMDLTVTVTWTRGTGLVQDLGTKEIEVKRNCLNNVKIKLGSDDSNAAVKLTTESENFSGAEEEKISVE